MPFKKGQSGNPKGRPRGSINRDQLRESVAKDLPDILRAMATAAKGGDTTAARLLLDRVLPPLKAMDSPAPLAPSHAPADLAGTAAAVLAALTSGEATPDQAASLASVLASLARVREITNLEQRIAALEDRTHEVAQNPR